MHEELMVSHTQDGCLSFCQAREDITLRNGVVIPKGYCNATQMCQNNGKRLNNYMRLSGTKELIGWLQKSADSDLSQRVLIPIEGGTYWEQGTWVHPDIAIDVAMWLNIEFRLWAIRAIQGVLNGTYEADPEELRKSAERGRKLWLQIREDGIMARNNFTDRIKEIMEADGRYGQVDPRERGFEFAKVTNAVYKLVFGMDADQLKKLFNCAPETPRNYLSRPCLKAIEFAEDVVAKFIQNGHQPLDAVKAAAPLINRIKPERKFDY